MDHENVRGRSRSTGFPLSVVVSKENPKVSPIFTSQPQAATTSIHRTLSTDKPNILCRSVMSVTSSVLPGHLCYCDDCLTSRAASPSAVKWLLVSLIYLLGFQHKDFSSTILNVYDFPNFIRSVSTC